MCSKSRWLIKVQKVSIFFENNLGLLLLLGLFLWIVCAGVGIWSYAVLESEPPVFDALSYVQKAQTFWAAIFSFEFFNPLSLEPTVRPFGTILLSYPFGFSEDFRGFYFRSDFVPLVLVCLSAFIFLPYKRLMPSQKLVFISLLLVMASVPSFFQFSSIEGVSVMGTWGFVDLFLASISALSVAFILRPTRKFIQTSCIASLLAAFSILIKPVGLVLMLVLGMIWVIISLAKYKSGEITSSEFVKGAGVFTFVYSIIGGLLFNSQYFSNEHYQYGIQSMKALRALDSTAISFSSLIDRLSVSIGVPLLVILLAGLILSFNKKYWHYCISTILTLAAGLILWLVLNNVDHVRYFIPFPFMAVMLLMPVFIDLAANLSFRKIVVIVIPLLIPTAFIGYLLLVENPKNSYQHLVGINLSSNTHAAEVAQANKLILELENENSSKSSIIYLCGVRPLVKAFESVIDWHRILKLTTANLVIDLPITWVREHAYRLDRVLGARFIVFEPILNPKLLLQGYREVNTFEEEELVVRAWLTTLNENDGVRVRSESGVRVIEILDVNKILITADEFYSSRKWRKAFIDGFTQHDLNARKINLEEGNLLKNIVNLRDSSRRIVMRVKGVFVGMNDNNKVIKIVVDQLHRIESKKGMTPWFVFVHQLGVDGSTVVSNAVVPLRDVPTADGKLREYKIVLTEKLKSPSSGYAIGVFSPRKSGTQFLFNEAGDWGGRRIVVKY